MSTHPTVRLGEVCRPRQWTTLSKKDMVNDGFAVYGANGKIGFATEFTHAKPTLLIGCRGSCGSVHITEAFSYANGNAMALDDLDESIADLRYLYHYFLHRGFRDVITGTSQPQIIQQHLRQVEIPLPPLEEQRRIAAILDKASTIKRQSAQAFALAETLCLARLEQLLDMNKDLLVGQRLEELCVPGAPITYGILQPGPDLDGGVPYVRPSEIKNSQVDLERLKRTSPEIAQKYSKSQLRQGDILLTIVGTIGETAIVPAELEGGNITQSSARIRIDTNLANPLYIYYFLKAQHVNRQIERDRLGVAVERLNLHHVRDIEILCLPRCFQEKFTAEADSMKQLSSRH